MRRAAALAALVIVLTSTGTAGAQQGPTGYRLSSPPRAAGGTPIWVRSITPCPPASAAHVHRYVEAWIAPQNGSRQPDLMEVTGDVRDDGHWEVTLSAPNDFGAGATAHYYVRAVCAEDDPWGGPVTDEGDPDALAEAVVYYEPNSLHVTASGGTSTGNGDGGGGSGETTTTTADTTTSTTATTVATTSTTAAGGGAQVESAAARAARIEKIRAELEAQGVDTSTMSDREVLATAPLATTREPVDDGIPWWAFVLATFLAVSAVIAFGVRRSA